MSLKINVPAPNIELESTSNRVFQLHKDIKGFPCVIFFYPADFSPYCTQQVGHFRDTFDFFTELEIEVFGISPDNIESHIEFKKQCSLPFELLSDPNKIAFKAYKALDEKSNIRRITYLLSHEHVVIGYYENLLAFDNHATAMAKAVKDQAALFKRYYLLRREARHATESK